MIIGHQRNIAYLERALAKGTLAHAYLFHGPEGVGKRTVAMAAGRSLLCVEGAAELGGPASARADRAPTAAGGLGGCGACEDCELVERRTHPDLLVLSAEEPLIAEEGRGIGIRNIHELQRRLALSAWRGGRKVVIIDGAEALSAEASSALLKTLEEPDAATTFFIITSSPGAILETIRSRSVPMSFTAVGEDEITGLLGGVPPARRRSIAALAAGRPGLVLRLARETEFFEEFQGAEAERAQLCRADLGEQLNFSERASREPAALASFLGYLLYDLYSGLHAALASSGAAPAVASVPAPRRGLAPVGLRPARGERLAGESIAGRAKLLGVLLERVALLQTTTVNRRLIADSVFVELAARGGRHPA